MDNLNNAAFSANIRAAARRIIAAQGADALAFATERLEAASGEGDATEVAMWNSIIVELSKFTIDRVLAAPSFGFPIVQNAENS